MKITDKFTFTTNYATYNRCNFVTNQYMNGNLYLAIENEEEGAIITCSVNGSRINGKGEIGIKNYSENEGMVTFLKTLGIIEEKPIAIEHSGFVLIPYFRLTESGKELFGIE